MKKSPMGDATEDIVRSNYLRDFFRSRQHRLAYEEAVEQFLDERCSSAVDKKELVRFRKLLASEDAHCCLTFIWKESDFIVVANLARDIVIAKKFAERDLSANALTGAMLEILRNGNPDKKDALKRRIDEIVKAAERCGLIVRREIHPTKKLVHATTTLDQLLVDVLERSSK